MLILPGDRLFVHKGIRSRVQVVELVSDRMSYIILSDYWCDITVLCMPQLRMKAMIQWTVFMRN
jgi:hypothetical protein